MRIQGAKIVDGEILGYGLAKSAYKFSKIIGPQDGHGNVANSILQQQVPSDDPGHELSQRIICIGVGAAGNRNHGGKLGIAQSGKPAGNSRENKKKGYCWSACGCCIANGGKNSCTNQGSY